MSASEGVQPETLGLAASAPKLTLGLMADLIKFVCRLPVKNIYESRIKKSSQRACIFLLTIRARCVLWPATTQSELKWRSASAGWARSEISYPGRSEKGVKLPL
jgi:hypothetical protein